MKPRKTKKILDEASFYTGSYSGQQAPETTSAYEFSKDSVPTLNKIEELRNKGNSMGVPEELPFPFQNSVKDLSLIHI